MMSGGLTKTKNKNQCHVNSVIIAALKREGGDGNTDQDVETPSIVLARRATLTIFMCFLSAVVTRVR